MGGGLVTPLYTSKTGYRILRWRWKQHRLEALFNTKPEIAQMKPFGAVCFVHIPKERRPAGSKMDPRAEKALFLRYTESHKIYNKPFTLFYFQRRLSMRFPNYMRLGMHINIVHNMSAISYACIWLYTLSSPRGLVGVAHTRRYIYTHSPSYAYSINNRDLV